MCIVLKMFQTRRTKQQLLSASCDELSPSESHFRGDKSDQLQKRGLEEESVASRRGKEEVAEKAVEGRFT